MEVAQRITALAYTLGIFHVQVFLGHKCNPNCIFVNILPAFILSVSA